MDSVLERIAAWEAAGLIDAATAERLRASEAARPADVGAPARPGPSQLASSFGPPVSIGEMFAYLGGAFLLGGYAALVARLSSEAADPDIWRAAGAALAALAAAIAAIQLLRGDARRRRAAGVFFGVSVASLFAAWLALGNVIGLDGSPATALGAAAAALGALLFRQIHPALLTQFALLAAITGLVAAVLDWLRSVVSPTGEFGEPVATGLDPIMLVAVSAIAWLGLALVFGWLALREARLGQDRDAAVRRASLTRMWAGLTAVLGLTSAVTRSGTLGSNEFGRVLEPWIGDLALLVLAAVLVERAFRRDSNAFVYAAAIAVMIALSDFNFSYLSATTEVGLLIEGVILLGAAFAADRLRRRIGEPDTPEPTADRPTPA
jgi:hypothetical protein